MNGNVLLPGDRVQALTPNKPLNRRKLAFH